MQYYTVWANGDMVERCASLYEAWDVAVEAVRNGDDVVIKYDGDVVAITLGWGTETFGVVLDAVLDRVGGELYIREIVPSEQRTTRLLTRRALEDDMDVDFRARGPKIYWYYLVGPSGLKGFETVEDVVAYLLDMEQIEAGATGEPLMYN